jgi:hypothetical protein
MNKAQYDAHSSVMRRLGTVPGAEQAIKFFQPDPFPESSLETPVIKEPKAIKGPGDAWKEMNK